MSTARRPASRNSPLRKACVARVEPLPGRDRPSASVRQFIEFAVNMPEQDPQVGQAASSMAARSASDILSSAAATMASTRSSETLRPSPSVTLPASIGPPETKIAGMFSRIAASSMPGVILSQFEMQTMASAQCALTMYSTESAISSREGREYSIPSWPMAMPSSTAMVLNSLAMPPDASTSRATIWPRSLRWTWPGTNWVKLLTMAMMGLPKSLFLTPVARQRPRAPAMLRPWVVVRERYAGMAGFSVVLLSGLGRVLAWHGARVYPPIAILRGFLDRGRGVLDCRQGAGSCGTAQIPGESLCRCCRGRFRVTSPAKRKVWGKICKAKGPKWRFMPASII
jgi:hypothetical protein